MDIDIDGHAGTTGKQKPQQKAVVVGLKASLLKTGNSQSSSQQSSQFAGERNLEKIQNLVNAASCTQFHAYAIAALYANSLVQTVGDDDTQVGGKLHKIMGHKYFNQDKKIFNQTLLDQVIALAYARNSQSTGTPQFLKDTAEKYFAGQTMANVPKILPPKTGAGALGDELRESFHADIRLQMRETMKVAFQNCMEISTPQNMASFLRQTYGLNAKEVKTVSAHLGTSREKRFQLAKQILEKPLVKKMLQDRDLYLKALKEQSNGSRAGRGEASGIRAKKSQKSKSEKALRDHRQKTKTLTDAEIDAAILSEFKFEARHRRRGLPDGIVLQSIEAIIAIEKPHVPATQSQWDQLKYRWNLLSRFPDQQHANLHCNPVVNTGRRRQTESSNSRLPVQVPVALADTAIVAVKKFNLVPCNKFSRVFIRFTKASARCLLDEQVNEKNQKIKHGSKFFKCPDSLAEMIPLIFEKKAINHVKSKSGRWNFGSSFQTDGVQLHFMMENEAAATGKLRRTAATKASKQEDQAELNLDTTYVAAKAALAQLARSASKKKRNRADDLDDEAAEDVDSIAMSDDEIVNDENRFHQLQQVVNAAKARVSANRKKRKQEEIEAEADSSSSSSSSDSDDEVAADDDQADSSSSSASGFKLPANAVLVGLDPNIKTVCGVSREGQVRVVTGKDGTQISKPVGWKYSLATYRHDVGLKRREKTQQTKLEQIRNDAENTAFASAEIEVNAVSTKTHIDSVLLNALQVRGKHYLTLFAYYGHVDQAYEKFASYMGSQRVLHRLVQRVAPIATRDTDFIVVGDGNYSGSSIVRRGNPSGVAGKLIRALKKQLKPGHVLSGNEFRSSIVDSQNKSLMYHPPRLKVGIDESNYDGPCVTKRVYSIYQSSAPGYSCTYNRDVNAAINIRQNFRYQCENNGEMPYEFCRENKLPQPASLQYRYREVVSLTNPPTLPKMYFKRWLQPLLNADA